nr:transferrin-binding protein-like solute binding protein [uncultured Cardiobacterium sp.]
MKLNNLTIAVLIALGTAACGGSDDATTPPHVDPTPTPTPQPDNNNNQAGRDDKALVDPTDTHVVDNRDLSKESTVGGLQYIRRDGSRYDRANNPEQMASATPLLGVSLNEQNPKLTNIVLARRDLDYKDGEAVRAQFAGGTDVEPLTAAGKPHDTDSLQVENFKNVDVLAGAFKQVGSAVFNDPNNRLDGTTHNIDTHIQNNTDKDGEFTRERVTHVFTPRYEYRQPFVDYPNAVDPANNYLEHPSDTGIATIAPPPPSTLDNMSIDQLQEKLKNHPGWVNTNVVDNSRHPVNTGTKNHGASGNFANIKERYGNLPTGVDDSPTDPADVAPANRWRNIGDINNASLGHNNVPDDATGTNAYNGSASDSGPTSNDDAKKYNLVNWQGRTGSPGAFSGTVSHTQRLDRATGHTLGSVTYSYQQSWPNGAYPKYSKDRFAYPNPNRPYTESSNNALNGGTTPNGDPLDHEHIYLEREEYTAIRQNKSIRPLVNPVANEWEWTLENNWRTTYTTPYRDWSDTAVYTTDPVTGQRIFSHYATTYSNWTSAISSEEYTDDDDAAYAYVSQGGGISNARSGAGCTSNSPGSGGSGRACDPTTFATQLQWARWKDPTNLGGGQRGEFRGPPYIGWKEDDRVVRFADERIWKPGTPGYKPEYENKYGANLIWWSTQDSAFENWATSEGWNPRARRVDINTENCPGGSDCGEGKEDLVWANNTNDGTNARDRDVEIQPTGDITNGLIRIGGYGNHGEGQPQAGNGELQTKTLGEELKFDGARWNDHHKTTTRIFGHYHLAYADQDDRVVKAMSMNSYSGARSFVSQVEGTLATPTAQGYRADLDSKPTQYSIGAKPITLQKVQYGRVTSNLDLTASGANLLPNGFLRAPFEKKGTDDSVDNYFFRGVDETTIDQMNALPSNQVARYEGHALMYGIDNSFHGVRTNNTRQDLPNAFDGTGGSNATAHTLGLGNFVEADVNFGTKKVTGDVYNAWLERLDKPGVYKDKLVTFNGDVIGNTVIGTADRTYAPGDDEADFRAAFYGSQADEMGGSFNSVKATNKYGSAYEVGDWGGVFGATKVGTNTFQGDDGGQNYGGGSAPAQTSVNDRYAP